MPFSADSNTFAVEKTKRNDNGNENQSDRISCRSFFVNATVCKPPGRDHRH